MQTQSNTLEDLAAEAQRLEPINPQLAASAWSRCLPLLHPSSPEHQAIRQRIGMLLAAPMPRFTQVGYEPAPPPAAGIAGPRNDSLAVALLKTGGSALLSMLVYAWAGGGWAFAVGFVLLILVHELGHTAACLLYGIKAGPPIFIPFVGALINLRSAPPNAKVEAVVGIAGPLAGTLGAILCYVYGIYTGQPIFIALAHFAFFMNLFNLLPVPPLDGGRAMAAVSPWVWIIGLALAGIMVLNDIKARGASGSMQILVILLIMAVPRVLATLKGQGDKRYYTVPAATRWLIGATYALLAVALWVLTQASGRGGIF